MAGALRLHTRAEEETVAARRAAVAVGRRARGPRWAAGLRPVSLGVRRPRLPLLPVLANKVLKVRPFYLPILEFLFSYII